MQPEDHDVRVSVSEERWQRYQVALLRTRADIGSPREVFFERGEREETPREGRAVCWDDRNKRLRNEAPTLDQPEHNSIRIIDDYNARVKDDGIVPAVRQTFGHESVGNGAKIMNGPRIRRLMPIETERLMSWPDSWTRYGTDEDGNVYEQSDTQRYKMCGNGVVSAVVSEVVKAHLL